MRVYTTVVYRSNFNSEDEYNDFIENNYDEWEIIKRAYSSEVSKGYTILIKEVRI